MLNAKQPMFICVVIYFADVGVASFRISPYLNFYNAVVGVFHQQLNHSKLTNFSALVNNIYLNHFKMFTHFMG